MKALLKLAKVPDDPGTYAKKYDGWARDANSPEHLKHLNDGLAHHAKKKFGKELHKLSPDEWGKAYHHAARSPKMKALHKKHFGH